MLEELWSFLRLPGAPPEATVAPLERMVALCRASGQTEGEIMLGEPLPMEHALIGWMLSEGPEVFWESIAARLAFVTPVVLGFLNSDVSLVIDGAALRGDQPRVHLVDATCSGIGMGTTPLETPVLRDLDDAIAWLLWRMRDRDAGVPPPRAWDDGEDADDGWDSICALVDAPVMGAWSHPLGARVDPDREDDEDDDGPSAAPDLAWLRRATTRRIERVLVAGDDTDAAPPEWAPRDTRLMWDALDAWRAARWRQRPPDAIVQAAAGKSPFAAAARAWLARSGT